MLLEFHLVLQLQLLHVHKDISNKLLVVLFHVLNVQLEHTHVLLIPLHQYVMQDII